MIKRKEEFRMVTVRLLKYLHGWERLVRLMKKRKAEEEKALCQARALEEQDNMLAENDDNHEEEEYKQDHLSGVKVLHGLDKALEGAAVVMTLKDQSILLTGISMKRVICLRILRILSRNKKMALTKLCGRNEHLLTSSMKIHCQRNPYSHRVTLDEGGRFTGGAERKLEELRKRIEGGHIQKMTKDHTSTTKVSTDYFTPNEMVQFKKPKKKKSLWKKEKLDLDALEAEAIAAGLGAADLGSRKDSKRQSAREEEQKADAEKRSSAYQASIAKAEEASKALRQDKTKPGKSAEEEDLVFGEY